MKPMFNKSAMASVVAIACLAAGSSASALTVTGINSTTGIGTTLVNALLAPSSGLTIDYSQINYQGTNTSSLQQSGTYTGFNLAPATGSTPTLTMGDGIVLSSGRAAIGAVNNANETSQSTGSGSNAALTTLSGQGVTNDANVLSFKFKTNGGQTSVSAQFVFGTEEFPTQAVTDIFGFFVDGVNFAKFPSGELISNTSGNPTNFIANTLNAGLYPIQYNGLTQVFTVTGLLGTADAQGFHTLSVGVADTNDTRYDSAVYLSNLLAGTVTAGGGIGNTPPPSPTPTPTPVPPPTGVSEPAALGLMGLAMALLASRRRRSTR